MPAPLDDLLGPDHWPRTLEEAVDLLVSSLSPEDRDHIRTTPRRDLILFHHGWGSAIRNAFGLWRGNDELYESCGGEHPDSCSMEIIRAVWERLQQRGDQ